MICLMVFNLTTPEDFSLPASLGSVSVEGKKMTTTQDELHVQEYVVKQNVITLQYKTTYKERC